MRVFTAFSKLGKHLTVISSFCLPPLPLKVWTVCVQAHDTVSKPTEPFFMYFRFLCPLSSWVSLNAIYFSTIDLFFRYICLLVNSVCIFWFCIFLYFSVLSFSFCILFLNFRYKKKIFRHSFEFFLTASLLFMLHSFPSPPQWKDHSYNSPLSTLGYWLLCHFWVSRLSWEMFSCCSTSS